jgi:hypothetical protein
MLQDLVLLGERKFATIPPEGALKNQSVNFNYYHWREVGTPAPHSVSNSNLEFGYSDYGISSF